MLIISVLSTKYPSQFLDVTYSKLPVLTISCSNVYTSCPIKLDFTLTSGNTVVNNTTKVNIVTKAKGMLLLVSLISSETLILINININKNKIDTAPT